VTSAVNVANIALMNIGSMASISSFNEASTEANALSALYEPKLLSVLRAVHWNFARAQTQGSMTLLKAATGTPENPTGAILPQPPQPWLYEYAWPPDCIQARYLLPLFPNNPTNPPIYTGSSTPTPICWGPMNIPFLVASDFDSKGNRIRVILTNLQQAQMVYTCQIDDPDLWDSAFFDAFTATLGAFLVNPLVRNHSLLADQIKLASDLIAQARMNNGDEGPSSTDHIPDWIRVRMGGWGYWGDGYYIYPYQSLVFPGGYVC
jgi:hypothetical protein